MTNLIGVVERENLRKLVRRQTLRDAARAIRDTPKHSGGKSNDLIRRKDAASAIERLDRNGLAWGCIFLEEDLPEPPEAKNFR
jgi:hypothetical protein